MDLSLVLRNTSSWGIYSIAKELKYTAVFLSTKIMAANVFLYSCCHWDLWYTLHLLSYVNGLLKKHHKPRFVNELLSNFDIA